MSAPIDDALMDDIRVLLSSFAKSGARLFEARLRDNIEVRMFARDENGTEGRMIRAPHVGTIRWLATVGTVVKAGETVATFDVLEDSADIPAPFAGIIGESDTDTGRLIQFDEPILRIFAQE